ncbi:MAG: NAD(P)H-hydrate dehydratase [Erythrobacter sp. 34-65-8]|nr:MAG: NAD(P)H-hydrate dehydratase [Erythrobacter sp. 34-65-8]
MFVDCLFGSGLSRPLSAELCLLLRDLADRHAFRIAVDLPSGISSDDGHILNERLPDYHLTLALGAWKYAHWRMPACASMGERRLVPIGVAPVLEAAELIQRPRLSPPEPDAHKYTRGLCAVVAGEMPGATLLACKAATHGGAGYVKLQADSLPDGAPIDLVVDAAALDDDRLDAVLVGPGLGRSDLSRNRLEAALSSGRSLVLDADALHLLAPHMLRPDVEVIATPHEGELAKLCKSFAVVAQGKTAQACALARASGMVIIAKGPDTIIAAPDGRLVMSPSPTSWLSVAGTGDVLAGIVVSRVASGQDPFEAACEAVWLHAEAARRCSAPFTASELAGKVAAAYAACL